MDIKVNSKDINKWFQSFSGDLKIQVGNRWIDISKSEGDSKKILDALKANTPVEFKYNTLSRRLVDPSVEYAEPVDEPTVTEWAKERRKALNKAELEVTDIPEEETSEEIDQNLNHNLLLPIKSE